MDAERRADDRLSVWILVTALSTGGAERTIVDLANRIDRDRYDVVVWTLFDANPLAERLEVPHRSLGVRPANPDAQHRVDRAANPLDYLRAPVRFLRAVRRERPAILHTFLFYDNLIARAAGLVAPGTAVLNGIRGYHNDSRPLAHGVDRLTLPLSDAVVSNSRAGAEYLRDRGLPENAVAVVPNGRDLDAYRDGSADGLRDEFDVPEHAPVVGTVGRLVERKGQFDLLRAWALVRESHPDAHLVVVGYGPEREALEALASELGVTASVRFTGARDDIPAVLDLLDVFAFPSHWEGHPGALLEAMAAGLPIVASDISGNDELVVDHETGLLVPPRDPPALARGINTLLSDGERARTLGEAARTEAYDRFTLTAMVDRFERVYDSVTDPKATVPSEVAA
jgi:glycosyltransferase involved in cell wall biosynthesis